MSQDHSFTVEQIEQYRNEGFIVVERLFDADDMARVDATIQQMTDQALGGDDFSKILELEPQPVDGKRVPRRIFNPYDQHETFRALAHDSRLLDKIESLIGGDFNLQHFGGPRPLIPNVGKYASLYELQSQAKAQMK